jgi:hypothetical protein
VASKFGDQVKAHAEKYKLRQAAIFRESAQAVLEEANTPEGAGGRMPVDTSFLRNSAAASTEGPATAGSEPALVFSGLKLGEKVWAGWTAVYAMRIEHGFQDTDSLGREYNQSGKGFMRAAAQNWDFIVARVTAEVKEKIP